MNSFEKLFALNVNEHTEGRNGFTYLTWSWAWAEFKKVFPEATYEVKMFDNKPYIYDENLGYMVMTSVTVEGLTYDMWLPVMDNNNKAMKKDCYTVKTKFKEIKVEPATMFDVNKAIMRCLVKNLAMFGLGLYIYSGEDLPEEEANARQEEIKKSTVPVPFKPIKCEKCGKEIKAVKAKDGTEMTSAEVADFAYKKTGKFLCAECMKGAEL